MRANRPQRWPIMAADADSGDSSGEETTVGTRRSADKNKKREREKRREVGTLSELENRLATSKAHKDIVAVPWRWQCGAVSDVGRLAAVMAGLECRLDLT